MRGAFLQGMTFEDLAQERNELRREVFFTLPNTEDWQELLDLETVRRDAASRSPTANQARIEPAATNWVDAVVVVASCSCTQPPSV